MKEIHYAIRTHLNPEGLKKLGIAMKHSDADKSNGEIYIMSMDSLSAPSDCFECMHYRAGECINPEVEDENTPDYIQGTGCGLFEGNEDD